MQQFLYGSLLLPAFEGLIKGRQTFRYWRELEQSQWYTRSELEQMQFDRLQQLVRHAFAHCPYYRQRWQELSLHPTQLLCPRDWQRWPLLSREDVSANRLQLRADRSGQRLLSKSTGGSSGMPLHFDLDLESHERRTAATYRGYNWANAGPGTKQLYLWGIALGQRSWRQRLKDRLWERLNRRLVLNCFDLSEERLPAFLHAHNRYRPDVIVAYTNALYFFARMLAECGLTPRPPRSIIVGAEKLYSFQRELIEKVFQAPVFETYGSREFMLMGAECDRHAGLHLTTENLLVEVLNDEGRPVSEGEEGNVVVTDLTNRGMPFLRYANGDRAVAGCATCSCGRGLSLLGGVVGRRLDVLRTPDGHWIPGEVFPHLLKDYVPVRRFQVIQDEPDHVQVKLVVGPNWNHSERERVGHALQEVLSPAMRLDLAVVDDIPLTRVGKLRVVVNQCESFPGPARTVPLSASERELFQVQPLSDLAP
jgi:phenylacetate-CoA ligase